MALNTSLFVRLAKQGAHVVVPIVLTIYFSVKLFLFFDKSTRWLVPEGFEFHAILNSLLGTEITYLPGAGILCFLVLCSAVGYVAQILVKEPFTKTSTDWIHHQVNKIPIVGLIYRTTRKLTKGFAVEDISQLQSVVWVQYTPTCKEIGFIIVEQDASCHLEEDEVIVYVPTMPNPFTGRLAAIKKEFIKETKFPLTVAEGLMAVMSGGLSLLNKEALNPNNLTRPHI